MALSPLLGRFKDATAELHREAERYVRILDRGATLAAYRRYLLAMHGFHAPLEACLARNRELDASGFATATRRKTPWLEHDLRALAVHEIAACDRLPDIATLPRAIGAGYVTEGSTLGGRFILAKLPPAIAGVKGTATRFLEGYGAATGAMWRAFAVVAETIAPDDHAEAIAAACETFERLIAWLATFEDRAPLAEAS